MAFNNRPATDTIPFLSPFLAPSARALGPLLQQLASPGPLRATAESAFDALRGLSPGLVKQVRSTHSPAQPLLHPGLVTAVASLLARVVPHTA